MDTTTLIATLQQEVPGAQFEPVPTVDLHMTMVARALERVGDNAVDIGEQCVFVVSGLFREFQNGGTRPTAVS